MYVSSDSLTFLMHFFSFVLPGSPLAIQCVPFRYSSLILVLGRLDICALDDRLYFMSFDLYSTTTFLQVPWTRAYHIIKLTEVPVVKGYSRDPMQGLDDNTESMLTGNGRSSGPRNKTRIRNSRESPRRLRAQAVARGIRVA